MKDYFSLIPWTGTYIKPNGNVYPCESIAWNDDERYCVGNLLSSSLDEMWNHKVYRDIRLQVLETGTCILDNTLKNSCTYLQTRKNLINDIEFYRKNTGVDGSFDFDLKTLYMERSSICNLTCVYCNDISSTSWAKKLNRPAQKRIPDEVYWDRINPYLPTINEISISGGEPVLDPFNEELLDKLIGLDRHINVNMATNVTYDLDKKASFFQKLEKFDTKVMCSIDSHGELFEKIREGSDWNLVFNNLKRMKTMNFQLLYNMTVNVLNCFSLKDHHIFLMKNGLADVDSIRYITVDGPPHLCIRNLSESKKEELKISFLKYIIYLQNLEKIKGEKLSNWCNNKPTSEAIYQLIPNYLYK